MSRGSSRRWSREPARFLRFRNGGGSALVETLDTGQRIAAPDIMYHGVKSWMLRQERKRGLGLDLFDATKPDTLERAIKPGKTSLSGSKRR